MLALAAALGCCGALAQEAPDCPPMPQPPSAEQASAGVRDAQDHGFLWRVRQGGHVSYLYGTVHVAKREWMVPGPAVIAALAAIDTVALELDMLDPEVQRRLAQGIAAAPRTPLPETLRLRLAQQADAACLPPGALAGLGPELQIATLASLVGRRDGLDPAYGIDAVLAGWGHASGKTVVSLETPELQLAALQMANPAETLEFIDSSLAEIESGRAAPALRRIAKVWADADLETLTQYASWCDCLRTPAERATMARLLDERNPALARSIETLHRRGRHVFAAVGSLHMIGPLGLPALLARHGFEVERVRFAR